MGPRPWIFIVPVAALPFLPVPEILITQANYVGLQALAVMGLVLLTGICGLMSFGQAAFIGIGAYSTAYLTTHFDISPWVSLVAGLGTTELPRG
jgi:branched-chain amino acid transport system permease protein